MEVLEGNLTKNAGVGEKSSEDQVVVEKFIYATWDMSLGFPEINKQLARVTGWKESL